MTGTVARFDTRRGLGVVTGEDGTTYPFHCTQIADGSRSIEVGTTVSFEVVPRLGRYEAGGITPAQAGDSAVPVEPESCT